MCGELGERSSAASVPRAKTHRARKPAIEGGEPRSCAAPHTLSMSIQIDLGLITPHPGPSNASENITQDAKGQPDASAGQHKTPQRRGSRDRGLESPLGAGSRLPECCGLSCEDGHIEGCVAVRF